MVVKVNFEKKYSGVVALTTLLVMATVLVVTGISVVYLSIDSAAVSRNYLNLNRAKSNVQSCLDEALLRITLNRNYLGSGTVTIDGASCTYTVTNHSTNSNYKVINIDSLFEANNYKDVFTVDKSVTPLEIIE